jgi:hypothetical protein
MLRRPFFETERVLEVIILTPLSLADDMLLEIPSTSPILA